jgi:hypothetical protein
MGPEPTEAEIRHAAHQLWLEQGQPDGRELDHWFAAKQTLLHHHGRTTGRGKKREAASVHFPSSDQPNQPTTPTQHP